MSWYLVKHRDKFTFTFLKCSVVTSDDDDDDDDNKVMEDLNCLFMQPYVGELFAEKCEIGLETNKPRSVV